MVGDIRASAPPSVFTHDDMDPIFIARLGRTFYPMAVHPTPGGDVMHGARIRCDDEQFVSVVQVFYFLLGADNR